MQGKPLSELRLELELGIHLYVSGIGRYCEVYQYKDTIYAREWDGWESEFRSLDELLAEVDPYYKTLVIKPDELWVTLDTEDMKNERMRIALESNDGCIDCADPINGFCVKCECALTASESAKGWDTCNSCMSKDV